MNKFFGKLDDENRIIYAPNNLRIDGTIYVRPSDQQYLQCGWLRIINQKPQKVGVQYVSTEFGDIVDGCIVRRYDEYPICTPIIQYDVNTLIYALVTREKWMDVRQVLVSQGLLEAFVSAGTIDSNFEGFDQIVSSICDAVGITEEERKEILHEAEVG